MRYLTLFRVFFYCCLAIPASAQTTFANIRIEALPTVFVTDRAGHEMKGQLLNMTDSELNVKTGPVTRTFTPDEVSRVERKGDSLKNGTLIGLGAGLIGAGAIFHSCLHSRYSHCTGSALTGALTWVALHTAIGTAIDAAIPGRTRIWPIKKVRQIK